MDKATETTRLCSRVRELAFEHRMFGAGGKVVVAVSGGPDSVALLCLLCDLREDLNIVPHVVHVNHKTRGGSSDRDAGFVADLAARLFECECTVLTADVPESLSLRGGSFEERARELRHKRLREAAKRIGAVRIALGHTLNDQAETVLMRLLRGAGSLGLAGMAMVRDDILVRPLLSTTRDEILGFLQSRGLPFVVDATNSDLRYTRNRIRHSLLPLLQREYNAQIISRLGVTAEILRDEQDWMEDVAVGQVLPAVEAGSGPGKIVLDVPRLLTYHVAIRRRVLRRAFQIVSPSSYCPEAQVVYRVLEMAARERDWCSLGGGLRAQRSGSVLVIAGRRSPAFVHTLVAPGVTCIPELGGRVETSLVDISDVELSYRDPHRALLDAEAVGDLTALCLRSLLPGDFFQPYGMSGRKKVARYLADAGVPRLLREDFPVMVRGRDIVWVVGQRIADSFRITADTRTVLRVVLTGPPARA